MTPESFLAWVDEERRAAVAALDPVSQRLRAQYFTPSAIARLMASMLPSNAGHYRLLEPGAGIGVLAAAAVAHFAQAPSRPSSLHITAYEIDCDLVPSLLRVLDECRAFAAERNMKVTSEVRQRDFLENAYELAGGTNDRYDGVILNPPYGKITTTSTARNHARALGVEVSNLYAAFWAAAIHVATEGGDVVAITPRSFCNGTYFRDFRRFLLESSAIRRLHVFDARDEAFSDQAVLQESLITHVTVNGRSQPVTVTGQASPRSQVRQRTVPYERVVRPGDPHRFIHVVPDARADVAAAFMNGLECAFADLEIQASTGPVVDFRAAELLQANPDGGTVPLLYPMHLRQGQVIWSSTSQKKRTSILAEAAGAKKLLVADGHYVLVKRFTAKEERRRVVAALYAGDERSGRGVAIENHLNYLHSGGRPLPRNLAVGLTAYLNSCHVDDYVRQFSGHTQINAGDLRSLRYPTVDGLMAIGEVADLGRLSDPAYFDELVKSGSAGPGLGTAVETDGQPRAAA